MSRMTLFGGENVEPDGKGFPSLYTIGVSLGRISRFCGHTREYYTVLPHVLTVASLLPSEHALHGLLHDAPEVCTADVPTPWKTQAARKREKMLLRRIYEGNNLPWPISEEAQEAVDWADRAALMAEAHVLGHPNAEESWPEFDMEAAAMTAYHLVNVPQYLEPEVAGPVFEQAFLHYAALGGFIEESETVAA